MVPLFAFDSWHYLYSIPLSIISVFLILVVLVQRGRGGGLTGALGGMGGQSAFGTKAGDLFTKITIVVAAIWILLAMVAIQRLSRYNIARPPAATTKDVHQDGTKAKSGAKLAPTTGAKKTDAEPADAEKSGETKDGQTKGADAKQGDAAKGDAKATDSNDKPAAGEPAKTNETKKD